MVSSSAGVVPPTPADFGADGLPLLQDGRGRRYTYARISLTDRCDMACVYCMPPGGEDEHAVRDDLNMEVPRRLAVLSLHEPTQVGDDAHGRNFSRDVEQRTEGFQVF